jgi:ABC-type multidrug transport system permease subunit
LRAWQLVAAYMAGAFVRALAAAVVIAVAATPFAGGVDQPPVAAAALVFTALVFSALGTIVGVWADTFDQHSFVTAIVVTPLALLGGVFYSVNPTPRPEDDTSAVRAVRFWAVSQNGGTTTRSASCGSPSSCHSRRICAVVCVSLRRG